MNNSRFWKYLMEDSDNNDLSEAINEASDMVGDTQELLQEYYNGYIDKSNIINVINEIRTKLDEIEDNL